MQFTSMQQKRVVELLLAGCRNKEIAYEMGLALRTIKMHLRRLYHINGIDSRVCIPKIQLAVKAHAEHPELCCYCNGDASAGRIIALRQRSESKQPRELPKHASLHQTMYVEQRSTRKAAVLDVPRQECGDGIQ